MQCIIDVTADVSKSSGLIKAWRGTEMKMQPFIAKLGECSKQSGKIAAMV